MYLRPIFFRLLCAALGGLLTGMVTFVDGQEPLREQARKIVDTHCVHCHNSTTAEGHLSLADGEGIRRGGEHGPVILPGRPDESSLLSRVRAGQMPPEGEEALSQEQIDILESWIRDDSSLVQPEEIIDESRITPILWLRCVPCHGARRKEGGLDLRSRESILQGGEAGPSAIPGDPEKSLLVQRVHAQEMPPRRLLVSVSVKPMETHELGLIESWIQAGLPESQESIDIANGKPDPLVTDEDRNFWAFQTPRFSPPPQIDHSQEPYGPIDAFLLEKLAANGLSYSASADRATLMRRVSIALTGLPPEPWEIEQFVHDDDPRSYERWLDRLLASPAYGERWARHWLDIAGYADSEGGQNEDRIRDEMWRYRDYVIRSFDSDKPYPRFIEEQLAGDELADWSDPRSITSEISDNLIATGFLRTAPDRTFAEITNFVPERLELIADEIRVLGSALLGLSLHCSRCHDHKFDPIPQRDYYRLAALLKDAYDEHDWLTPNQRRLPAVSWEERAEYESQHAQWQSELDKIRARRESEMNESARQALDQSIADLEKREPKEPLIRALWSRGSPSPTFILLRGNYLMPDREVGPDVLSVLSDGQTPLTISPPWPDAPSTGRRLALARWITSPTHPLTYRVIVNRLWHLHFGRGIVSTLDDFGHAGTQPTHPELLDWLALELIRNDGSLKNLHRKMLSSTAYRQTSQISQAIVRADPDNLLISRMNLLRPEAEVIRDRMWFVAGMLNRQRWGPPVPVIEHADGLVTVEASAFGERRSIYVLQRRTKLPTLLETFDSPQMSPNCTMRDESLVPLQSLHLLNNPVIHDLAAHFAQRIRHEAGEDPKDQITAVYLWAYGQPPTSAELEADHQALLSLREAWGETDGLQALSSYCHAILNSARFQYIE